MRLACLGTVGLTLLSTAWIGPAKLTAQALPPPERARLSVITFGRGDQVHQYFGHNALLVESPDLPEPSVINYGMFSFGPGMIPKFLKGRLEFWVGRTEYAQTVALYARSNRDVRVSELELSEAQRRVILQQVAHDLLPEHRVYLYDHYFDNCSTRLRDLLDRALDGTLKRSWAKRARWNLREQTQRYTRHDPWVEWLMMFGLNDRVDRPLTVWGQAFLPEEFEQLLDGVVYPDSQGVRTPLVRRKRVLFQAVRAALAAEPAQRWPFSLALGGLLAGCVVLLAERVRVSERGVYRAAFAGLIGCIGSAIGLLGTLLGCLWAFSDHVVAYHNENLWLANPLSLLAGVAGFLSFGGSRWAERWVYRLWCALAASSGVLLLLKLSCAAFDQTVTLSAAVLIPLNVGIAWACHRVWTRPRPSADAIHYGREPGA
jgi:hypothetical protein